MRSDTHTLIHTHIFFNRSRQMKNSEKVTVVITMTLYLHCWHATLCRQNITFLFVKQISKGKQISQVALNNSMKESEKIQVVYSQEKQAPKRQGLP